MCVYVCVFSHIHIYVYVYIYGMPIGLFIFSVVDANISKSKETLMTVLPELCHLSFELLKLSSYISQYTVTYCFLINHCALIMFYL